MRRACRRFVSMSSDVVEFPYRYVASAFVFSSPSLMLCIFASEIAMVYRPSFRDESAFGG